MSKLEPPYVEIADLLREGQIVPFLGAGVNFGRRPRGVKWDENTADFLPSGVELSHFLANRISFPSKNKYDLDDLAKVASFFVESMKRPRLRQRLHDVFNREFQPCDIHTYLAEVDTPLLIVTTNYDDLTERAFEAKGREYDLVAHLTDRKDLEGSVLWKRRDTSETEPVALNDLPVDLEKRTVIYKMHGTVQGTWQQDSYVITEDDYVDFLYRMANRGQAIPSSIMSHCRDRSFLFLGYGLRDWNLRVILKQVRTVLRDYSDTKPGSNEQDETVPKSWAIQVRPSVLEQKLWEQRDVDIYDLDINRFVSRLREHSR